MGGGVGGGGGESMHGLAAITADNSTAIDRSQSTVETEIDGEIIP